MKKISEKWKHTDWERTIPLLIVLLAFICINFFFVLRHEPWRDEAQTYLMDRDMSIPALINQMSAEGHAVLWHLLSYPFIKLGAPIYVQNIISLLLVVLAAILILFKSPFPFWLKVVVLATPPMMYFYPAVARCYALVPVLAFALAWRFPYRKEHPWQYAVLLALYVQTHSYMLMMAFLLCVWFLVEQIRDGIREKQLVKKVLPLAVPLASGIFLLYEWTPFRENVVKQETKLETIKGMMHQGSHLIQRLVGRDMFSVKLLILIIGLVALLFLVLYANAQIWIVYLIGAMTLLFQLWMMNSVWGSINMRDLLLVVVITWMMWMTRYSLDTHGVTQRAGRGKERVVVLGKLLDLRTRAVKQCWTGLLVLFVFFFLEICSVYYPYIRMDVHLLYSNSKITAEWVDANIPADAAVYTDGVSYMNPILAFTKTRRTMTWAGDGTVFSWGDWNKQYYVTDVDKFLTEAVGRCQKDKEAYIISVGAVSSDQYQAAGFQMVYHSEQGSMQQEDYAIYKYVGK